MTFYQWFDKKYPDGYPVEELEYDFDSPYYGGRLMRYEVINLMQEAWNVASQEVQE